MNYCHKWIFYAQSSDKCIDIKNKHLYKNILKKKKLKKCHQKVIKTTEPTRARD